MGWNHQRGFCSIFCCSNQQLCFSPGAGWYVWKLRDGRFECELGRTSASLVKIEWTVIYCTWFWHVFTVRSWKMRFLIGVWCWILNGIQSGEWKWSFFFGGGVVVSETDRLSNWWLQEKSRCFHCIRGKKVFFSKLLTVPVFNVFFVGIHCHAKEMPRALQARYRCIYIYIYICTLHICTAWWFRICNPS